MEKDRTTSIESLRAYLVEREPGGDGAAWALAAKLRDSNLLVSARRGKSRDSALISLAGAYAAETGASVLVVTPSEHDVASYAAECAAMARAGAIGFTVLGRDSGGDSDGVSLASIDAVASLSASGAIDVGDFGLVAICDIDSISDAAGAVMARRALGAANARRRVVGFAVDPGPAHRSLMRDLSGAFEETELGGGPAPTSSLPHRALRIRSDEKPLAFAQTVGARPDAPIAVFCDLRDTAETVARRLRSDGYRVDYILGSLPRKGAIHQSVVSGERDVLVLTDEGAEGLPGSWAGTLVNWDLPLDGEAYLKRLEHLNRHAAGASILDFVCERYEMGVAAAERAAGIAFSLEEFVRPADATERDTKPADPKPRNERKPGGEARPGGDSRGGKKRGEPRDLGDRYDGRNARSIQADIAAITGGVSLKSGSPMPQPNGGETKAQGKKKRRRGKKGQGVKAPAEAAASNRDANQDRQGAVGRRADGKDDGNRPQAIGGKAQRNARRGSQGARGKTGSSSGERIRDPYSVSMEERLERYKERYGKRADAGSASGPDRRSADRSNKPGAQNPGARGAGGPRTPNGAVAPTGARAPADTTAPKLGASGPDNKKGEAARPSKGLLDALRGLLGAGKDGD